MATLPVDGYSSWVMQAEKKIGIYKFEVARI